MLEAAEQWRCRLNLALRLGTPPLVTRTALGVIKHLGLRPLPHVAHGDGGNLVAFALPLDRLVRRVAHLLWLSHVSDVARYEAVTLGALRDIGRNACAVVAHNPHPFKFRRLDASTWNS